MRILVTGANGQVGWEVARSASVLGEVIACDRARLDLSQPHTLQAALDEIRPDVIVNAAAYTAVDRAEQEEALANVINGEAVSALARWARNANALLIHYSTDYVFDGTSELPYVESAPTCPLNAYGRSKLLGEEALAAEGGDYLCFRTTWVYGARGKNFMLTMLRLAQEREALRVVADQFGAPTSARLIADLTAHVVAGAMRERAQGAFASGLYNLTASGRTSWHEFASSIIETARNLTSEGTIKTTSIEAIPADAYPVPAKRPANSSLDGAAFDARFRLHRPDWRVSMVQAIRDALSV
ncbi:MULTISPECIES: dTDP-4-dehydrorhamnose reductase [unclassified Caballeronia]|uniref:dTDP-4-dehydrorhamnose reductase n=1 Tax=unclassified Caballeronia TaxID=2646786 RepID=UPI001F2C4FEC|nr:MULTISPECIES: dTDP-4-dehydrorhamnose reductase [unclassified Caballeronia]MCE4540907.1 dTDP-4-dehydrorhamnose reductase [Caballeronia sp. PC1]MCE4570050.1 dTDP-4-dehydrorhamnose reductase [Caballeronia sp. CLC5]